MKKGNSKILIRNLRKQEVMKKILYDKLNKRPANIQWFTDQDGDYWIDTDPYGLDMSGRVRIIFLKKDHPQYEVRESE